jgi:hypothetical protein
VLNRFKSLRFISLGYFIRIINIVLLVIGVGLNYKLFSVVKKVYERFLW